MAPGRPVKVIKIKVPRHNSQRIGAKLDGAIKRTARTQGIRTQIVHPTPDIAQAAESASEWNSLLMTARAERGPQWDVGTQQFLVDQGSDLYYNPSPLVDAVKKQTDAETAEEQQQQQQSQQPQVPQQPPLAPHQPQHYPPQAHSRHHTPRSDREYHMSPMAHPGHDPSAQQYRHHAPPVNYPYPPSTPTNINMSMGMNMNVNMRPPPPQMQGPYPGTHGGSPFNPMQSGQFYPGDTGSPIRMGPMGGMGGMGMMDPAPGMGGHPMGSMGIGGGSMQGMHMNLSPDMRRRMGRMGEDGFPMH